MRYALLALLVAAPLAAQEPWTEVVVDPAVLDAAALIYRQASTEVVFCVDGEYQPQAGRYVVRALVLAPQTHNGGDSAGFDCTGYDGWVHNHRDRGERYCAMSDTDRAALRENDDLHFALGWCRDGRWFHAFGP